MHVGIDTPGSDDEPIGVDDDGALLLETARGVKPFHSGDVSLRATGRVA